jgi:hypothetical protein
MLLLLYFCPNVKKSFLFKVLSSVDSQKMTTKYFLAGAWQMQKKNPKYNIVPISSPTLALVAPSQKVDGHDHP